MKKKKPGDTNAHTGQQQDEETKALIRGAIQVHAAPELINQHIADRKEDSGQKEKEYTVSKLTLGAVVVYAGLTFILVILSAINNCDSREAMRQSQRPWIGPHKEVPIFTGPIIIDDKGMIRTDYRMTAVNYGSYGANNVDFSAQMYVTPA